MAKSTKYPAHCSADDALPIPNLSFLVSAIIVFIVSVLCFANSYRASFAFDDSEAILNNKDVRTNSTEISDLFLHDFWGSEVVLNTSHKSYRPLTVISFRLNYWLAGGLHPMGFHMVNIFLHGVVSVLLFIFFTIVLDAGCDLSFKHVSSSRNKRTSFLCGLIFSVHPIHTENVSAIVGRADLLCAMSFMLAFFCYVELLNQTGKDIENWNWINVHSFVFFSSFFVLTACSMLFKEQGITVVGVCVAFDLIVVNKWHPLTLFGFSHITASLNDKKLKLNSSSKQESTKMNKNYFLQFRLFLLFIFSTSILISRWKIMGFEAPKFQLVDNPQSFMNGSFYRGLNYNYLYALNAWLLINPWWLCFDWSMGCIPLIHSIFDPRLLAVIFFYLVLGCLVVWSLFQQTTSEKRSVAMSLSMILIPFLPASNLLFRVGFVIAERNLYLSSAGVIVIVVLGIRRLCLYCRKISGAIMYLVIILYCVRSIQRSSHWLDEKVLFETGAQVCPLNAKVHYNIAKLHADLGNVGLAVSEYQLALRLNPEYDQAMNNLGNLYKDKGQLIEAEQLLERAVSTRSDFAAAWMNLGIVQTSLKKYQAAESSYLTALRHRKKYPDCFYNLGNLYLDLGRHTEALTAWQNATLQKPTHVMAWTNMFILLDNLGLLSDLERIVPIALLHNPTDSSIHFNYASALGKANRFEESEKHFLLAIQHKRDVSTYHSNLGVLYHRWKKFNKAEKQYKIALMLDPNNKQTMENLQLLKSTIGHTS